MNISRFFIDFKAGNVDGGATDVFSEGTGEAGIGGVDTSANGGKPLTTIEVETLVLPASVAYIDRNRRVPVTDCPPGLSAGDVFFPRVSCFALKFSVCLWRGGSDTRTTIVNCSRSKTKDCHFF
jgi:hypothetical protein